MSPADPASGRGARVATEHVRREHPGGIVAVADVSIALEPGELVVLTGPSGSGKTSLLSLVGALDRPTSGRVLIDGAPLASGADARARYHREVVGFVFQHHHLLGHLPARANVELPLLGAGLGRAERRERAVDLLREVGLAHRLEEQAAHLSGGERQRVALARALASGPSVLLLDEPFAALDLQTRRAVRGELRAFLQEVALPTVIVAHDPLDALVFGDRIVVLEEGKVTQAGPRDELLARPRTAFVAELAGLNVLRAEVAPGTGLKEARAGRAVFHVLADGVTGPAYLAFAPSEVLLSTEPRAGSAQNAFLGDVREISPLPDRLRVTVAAEATLIAETTREAVQALALAPGQRVWAFVKATGIRVYP